MFICCIVCLVLIVLVVLVVLVVLLLFGRMYVRNVLIVGFWWCVFR